MTTSARFAGAMLGLMGFWIVSGSLGADEVGVDAKAAFARLKTLGGDWKVTSTEEGHHASNLMENFKVTAAGSALMETQHAGTAHEMVTMYHLDGDDLKVTHYCAAGNQPRLKYDRKGSKPDLYSFVFDGGTNLDPAKDMHIHSFRLAFLDGGKVEADWEAYMDGKKAMSTKFNLSRP